MTNVKYKCKRKNFKCHKTNVKSKMWNGQMSYFKYQTWNVKCKTSCDISNCVGLQSDCVD